MVSSAALERRRLKSTGLGEKGRARYPSSAAEPSTVVMVPRSADTAEAHSSGSALLPPCRKLRGYGFWRSLRGPYVDMATQDMRLIGAGRRRELERRHHDELIEDYAAWWPFIKLLRGSLFWGSLIALALLAAVIVVLSITGFQPSRWWEQALMGIGLIVLWLAPLLAIAGFSIRLRK